MAAILSIMETCRRLQHCSFRPQIPLCRSAWLGRCQHPKAGPFKYLSARHSVGRQLWTGHAPKGWPIRVVVGREPETLLPTVGSWIGICRRLGKEIPSRA
jgi:hypothetical protein